MINFWLSCSCCIEYYQSQVQGPMYIVLRMCFNKFVCLFSTFTWNSPGGDFSSLNDLFCKFLILRHSKKVVKSFHFHLNWYTKLKSKFELNFTVFILQARLLAPFFVWGGCSCSGLLYGWVSFMQEACLGFSSSANCQICQLYWCFHR